TDRTRVVFPAPLGPRRATNSPGATDRSTPARAAVSPYRCRRFLTVRVDSTVSPSVTRRECRNGGQFGSVGDQRFDVTDVTSPNGVSTIRQNVDRSSVDDASAHRPQRQARHPKRGDTHRDADDGETEK